MNKIERLKLFESRREWMIFVSIFVSLALFQLYLSYRSYRELTASKFHHTIVTVLNQYPKTSKRGKPYFVLRLKSDEGYHFVTTRFEDLRDLRDRRLEMGFITSKITFWDYMRGFFAPSFDLFLLPERPSISSKINAWIAKQHTHRWMRELYGALFLAKPISKDLREHIAGLGVSHLIAISGYHLGFLYALLLLLLSPVYRFFQDRYFPYRNRTFDLGVTIMLALSGYAILIGMTPSIVRSLTMLIFGFFLYTRHFKIISFEVLAVSVLFLIAMDISLFWSVAFWFSVSGIFFIYLFLHYFDGLKKWQIALGINFWVYVMMHPIVHFIFARFSVSQLLSPILSLLFAIFYPLVWVLHLLGMGDLLDGVMLKLLAVEMPTFEYHTPLWFLAIYVALMIASIFWRWAFGMLILTGLGFWVRLLLLSFSL